MHPWAPASSCGRDFHFDNDVGQRNQALLRRHARSESHLGEGSIEETAQPDQRSVKYGTGGPAYSDIAFLNGRHGERGGMNEVSQFVRQNPNLLIQCLHAAIRDQRIAVVGVFRDGISDSVVDAAVERSKLVRCNWRTGFERQVRNGLTVIAVVVNNLLNRKPIQEQLAAVQRCRCADLGQERSPAAGRAGNSCG